MPYHKIDVECEMILCDHHDEDDDYCNYDWESSELDPDSINCLGFDFKRFSRKTASQDQAEELIDFLEDHDIPFACVNPESFYFQSILFDSKTASYGVIRGEPKDLKEFRFWKSVDGSIGYTHVNQLELQFS